MSAGLFIYDGDNPPDEFQTSFGFEFVDTDGSITNTDVNLVKSILDTANTLTTLSGGGGSGSYITVTTSGWSWTEPGPDPVQTRLDNIEGVLRKIQDRLSVIEDVDDNEMKKALKKAYDKYRMVEDMIEKKSSK